MKWISTKDEFPGIDDNVEQYKKRVRVIAAWGSRTENVAEMEYSEDVVRGKVLRRFKWNGRISPWNVTHWMPFPEPPK